MSNGIDTDKLKKITTDVLVESLRNLVVGDGGDLRDFATGIVNDAIEAGITGDLTTLAQLDDQRKVVQEVARIRFIAEGEVVAQKVIMSLLQVAVRLVIPAIPTLPAAGTGNV